MPLLKNNKGVPFAQPFVQIQLRTNGAFLWGDLDQDPWSKICLDHGASQEIMNPLWPWFISSFDELRSVVSDLGSLILIQITPNEHALILWICHCMKLTQGSTVTQSKTLSLQPYSPITSCFPIWEITSQYYNFCVLFSTLWTGYFIFFKAQFKLKFYM